MVAPDDVSSALCVFTRTFADVAHRSRRPRAQMNLLGLGASVSAAAAGEYWLGVNNTSAEKVRIEVGNLSASRTPVGRTDTVRPRFGARASFLTLLADPHRSSRPSSAPAARLWW